MKKGRPIGSLSSKRPPGTPYVRPPRVSVMARKALGKLRPPATGEKKPRPSQEKKDSVNSSRGTSISARNVGMGVVKPPENNELQQRMSVIKALLINLSAGIKKITNKSLVFDASAFYNIMLTWQAWLDTKHERVESKITLNIVQHIVKRGLTKVIETSFDINFFGPIEGRIDIDADVLHEIDYDREANPFIVTKYRTIRKLSGYLYLLEGWKTFRSDLVVQGDGVLDSKFRIISGLRYKPGGRYARVKNPAKLAQV